MPKSWKEYISEVKNVFNKEDMVAKLRSERGQNSDNPDQDSSNTETEDRLEYQKKELEYVNTELAKQTNKSNKKVKSLKKKIKKLKGKVSDLEDENEELAKQAEGIPEEPAEPAQEPAEGNEGEESSEGESEEEKPAEETEEGGEGDEEEKKEPGYDPDLDSVMDLGGKKKKKNESWERAIDQPIGVLLEAIEKGVRFEESYTWSDKKKPCWFASLQSPESKGVVVLKGSRELHLVGEKFTNAELNRCIDCMNENLPKGVRSIKVGSQVSPGTMNVMAMFEGRGWKLVVSDGVSSWDKTLNEEKLGNWLKNAENEKFWTIKGSWAKGKLVEDTAPKAIYLERE